MVNLGLNTAQARGWQCFDSGYNIAITGVAGPKTKASFADCADLLWQAC